MSDDGFTPDLPVIQSWVYHPERWFYVTTFERDSSARLNPRRYNHTLVYPCYPGTRSTGHISYEGGGPAGSLREHFRICESLSGTGTVEDVEP